MAKESKEIELLTTLLIKMNKLEERIDKLENKTKQPTDNKAVFHSMKTPEEFNEELREKNKEILTPKLEDTVNKVMDCFTKSPPGTVVRKPGFLEEVEG